jgi:phosphoglycerate dehydrogenase-like enzyme
MMNIDYDQCFARNIHCLVCVPVFAPSVAAMAMELVLTRGIVEHDTAFRCGEIIHSASSNRVAPLLRGTTMGMCGCANVGSPLCRSSNRSPTNRL